MRCSLATFRFESTGIAYMVSFCLGHLTVCVHDSYSQSLLEIDNRDRRYKPCITHAWEVLRLALNQQNTSNFAKRRTKAMKPNLKVRK